MRGVSMRLRADSSSRWRNLPAFSLVGGRILPVTGRIRTFLSLLASGLFQCLDVLGRYWGCKRVIVPVGGGITPLRVCFVSGLFQRLGV